MMVSIQNQERTTRDRPKPMLASIKVNDHGDTPKGRKPTYTSTWDFSNIVYAIQYIFISI